MRGGDEIQSSMFSYISPEMRVPVDHPLRAVRAMVDAALKQMSAEFDKVYSRRGRPSIAPERLFRALLLQIFYSIRSERLLMEQLDYNLLFRWFIGLNTDDAVWNHSTFSKNRERLFEESFAKRLFEEVFAQAKAAGLTSDEHFSVDGTLIEAWASHKSVRRKDGSDEDGSSGGVGRNAERNFRGEKRKNDTHASRTDPDARLARKSDAHPAQPSYSGHVLMENRNGLVAAATLGHATGTAEREAALAMLAGQVRARSLGADKGYDTRGFVAGCRGLGVTPHVAANHARSGGSAIDARTTRHHGYQLSQRIRKRIEEVFGWAKTIGPMRKTKLRGYERVGFQFVLTMTGYNLTRLRNLLGSAAA